MELAAEPSKALIAYAALANRLSKGGDVFQALMSFFLPIADEFEGQFFDPEKFCARVQQMYGLQVPKLAALGWCDRLVQEKLLEVHSRTGTNALYKWRRISQEAISSDLHASEIKVERLLNTFKSKCERDLTDDFYELSKDKLEAEFFDRLLRIDSMRLLLKKESNTSIKSSPNTLALKTPKPTVEDRLSIQLDFITAEFILNLRDSSQEDFELISSILFANMAAEALATFREPITGSNGIAGMRVYLDTPLILDMFKVNSGFESYASELWNLLVKSGAQIKVFDHTIQETESVVGGRLASIRSGNMPPMYSSRSELKTENLSMLQGRVGQSLEERGVVIERDPETSLLRVSARALGTVQAELEKKMTHWKRDAKYFDEKSVFSVIAIRSQMNVETSFVRAGAILLTRNTPLVIMANTAWRSWLNEATNESKSRIDRSAPIAISDKQFAGLVWMISGQELSNPLSRARIVAHCAAAIRPRTDVVAKACSLVIEAHGREEGERFAALMTNNRAEQAVMHFSRGDPDLITKDTASEVLEAAMLAAGALAAEAERKKAEAEISLISNDFEVQLISKSNTIKNVENDANLERAQAALELQTQKDLNERLKLGDMSREIRVFEEKISGYESAFTLGGEIYKQTQWLVAVLYVALIFFVGAIFTDHPYILALASSLITFAGFWILPGVLFDPLCQRIAQLYFSNKARSIFGISVENFFPDFLRREFKELEDMKLKKNDIDKALVDFRQKC